MMKNDYVSFPLGGIGAGMFCVQGNGTFGSFSLRNRPDVYNEPNIFAAVCVKADGGNRAKIIEGQVPEHKIFGYSGSSYSGAGNGLSGKNYGLPRFRENTFEARFPYTELTFADEGFPLSASLSAHSPFIPTDADDSSLPVATLSYGLKNVADRPITGAFYFSSLNFMKTGETDARVYAEKDGFILSCDGEFYISCDDKDAAVNTDLFDGGAFDVMTMLWNHIKSGETENAVNGENKSPGGVISVGFTLSPGQEKKITLRFAWHVQNSSLRVGYEPECRCSGGDCKPDYKPWYSGRFENSGAVMSYYKKNYGSLCERTRLFTEAFYGQTVPSEFMEAAAANLCILKSPTVLRQTDGRVWAWEGCHDDSGCCSGSCTHVWNYAQAMCHLFPQLERTLRKTEFFESQSKAGHQEFRASLPVRPTANSFHAAADGQLGGIMKAYREWRISGDNGWLREFWPKMVDSMDYCIKTWDTKSEGVLKEPHHNTYDIEFWGADGMCSSFYLGALCAMVAAGTELKADVSRYKDLYAKGREYMETKLFNGEYFRQEIEWETLDAKLDFSDENPKCAELLKKEGPKYQYGNGCLSDGVLGAWLAKMCGLGEILDPEKVKGHLLSVYKYNFKNSLIDHENPQRPGYAMGCDGGLLLCSWPRGGKPSLPFIYSDEVWTGIEYQVASHLVSYGYVGEGADIVRTCRARHDGSKRNPFDEYECGHWYARAMASYALIYAYTGVRYDGLSKKLYVRNKNDFKSFLSTASGFGIVESAEGKVSVRAVYGSVDVDEVVWE